VAKRCQVSGKKFNNAHAVTFSNKKNKYRQQPNLQDKRFWDEQAQRWVRLRVSTKVLKTIGRYGLRNALKRYGSSLEVLTHQ
jgi:large subunit ribosomal protein L28